MFENLIRKRVQPIIQIEVEQKVSECGQKLSKLEQLTIDNNKHLETLEFLLKMYQGKLKAANEKREQILDDYQKSIELQKLHCYIIPRLIESSGLEISEEFDINKYEDALNLYNRLRSGDLKDY